MLLVNIAILLTCIGIGGYQSYRKGLWLTVLSFASVLLSYYLLFSWGTRIIALLVDAKLNFLLAVAVMGIGVFCLSSVVCVFIPAKLFPKIKDVSLFQRRTASVMGAGLGVVFGFMLVWGAQTLIALKELHESKDFYEVSVQSSDQLSVQSPVQSRLSENSDVVSDGASTFLAVAARWGIKQWYQDAVAGELIASFVKSPAATTLTLKESLRSPELIQFWRDHRTQFLMENQDVEGLLAEPSFIALLGVPAVNQLLLRGMQRGEKSTRDTHRYFASQLVVVWQRVNAIKREPKMMEMLDDPKIIEAIKRNDTLYLLGNSKVQAVLHHVLQGDGLEARADIELQGAPNNNSEISDTLIRRLSTNKTEQIYKWMDDDGRTRYTDTDNTPARYQTREYLWVD